MPSPAPRRSEPFAGSNRQIRGAVVRVLRGGPATVGRLATATGSPRARIAVALSGLVRDGLVEAGPAALAGSASGRARLRA